ncbi:GGDEF domain-containing protein [Tepidimonas alkaliphilus]|uniref:GGDEF domain-containing protein n=1 Tax=Tepidimonas alkaliphilus TaxID=2588942 RepID=UPI001C8F4AAE|nr:GGDEF domain-containing protein [Tepidimonas alkaliphilus]
MPAPLLLALACEWLWVMDDQHRLVRMARLDGRPLPAELRNALGHAPWDSPVFHPGPDAWRRHRRVLELRQPFAGLELGWRRPGRALRWCAISGMPRFDAAGQFIGYVGVAQDITARKRTEQALRRVRADLSTTLRALPDLMFEIDRDGVFHGVHAPRPELLWTPAEAIVGRNHRELLPPEVWQVGEQALLEAQRHGQAYGYRYPLDLPAGRRWFELSAARKEGDAQDERFVVLVRDITELKRREDELSELAFYDALTGLPNRRLLLDRIEQALLRQGREPSWCALLFIDLDDFKGINDAHGHAAGDQVLRAVARRLRASVRDTDPLGRLGGDEFVALLTDLGRNAEAARQVAQRVGRSLLRRLRQPVEEAAGVAPSASIGILMFYGRHALGALLAQADWLMYRAKGGGKGRLSLRWFGESADVPSPCPPAADAEDAADPPARPQGA